MLKTIAIVTLAFATIVGCAQRDPVMAPAPGYDDLLPIQDYPRIVVTSGLAPYLGFSRPNVQGPMEGKPLSVVVPVRLLDDLSVKTQYRFRFFDSAGRPIEPEQTFRYLSLPARVQEFYKGAATDTNAVDWRLEVRPAR